MTDTKISDFAAASAPADTDDLAGIQGSTNAKFALSLLKGYFLAGLGTLISGTGAPSSGTGSNGQFYLDTAGAVLYGPKASGAWPAGIPLGGGGGGSGAPAMTFTDVSAAHTIALADTTGNSTCLRGTGSSAQAFTIPLHATEASLVGCQIYVLQDGAGQITVSGASGVTLSGFGAATIGNPATAGQGAMMMLVQHAIDDWRYSGAVA
jgi:hypothetical protein